MDLGGFSLSLAVKDLQKSIQFYKALGFELFHDNSKVGYAIMKGPNVNIGLFQGMFEKNLLTFNPGWDTSAQPLASFTDVREIQKKLKENGIELIQEVDESSKGPGSITMLDPDGNPILIDQHV